MQRRTFLTGTGVCFASSVAGCLGTVPGDETPTNRIEDITPDSPPDLPLTPRISIATAESTEDRPMRIAVKWKNEQQETVRFGEERSVMFHAAMSDNERAHLLSDEYGIWDDTISNDACWYVSGEVGGDGAYRVGELAPGEAHKVELGIYAATDECFTRDSYRFQNSISVWKSDDIPAHPPSEEWGFNIRINSSDD